MNRRIFSTPFQCFWLFVVAVFLLSVSKINKVSAQEAPVLEWAKATEGPGANNSTLGVAVDAAGNVYTTGSFSEATDFDPGPSVYTLSPGAAGGPAAFISKLDANGNFLWAKAIERTASSRSVGKSIAVTTTGDVYISGDFILTADFDPGPGVFNLVAAGNDDMFILKLDANGNFVWAVRFGNTLLDYGNSIATDAAGNVYTAGLFGSVVDFDPGPGVFNLTTSGSNVNACIVKLDSDGNLIWAKALGGTTAGSGSQAEAMYVDATNNVHVTGHFDGTVDFDPGIGTFTISGTGGTGFSNAFVTKLNGDGDLVWAKALGGTLTVEAYGISVDLSGNVLTTGVFVNTLDVDPGPGVSPITSVANSGDIFISKLDINGNFVWGKGLGSTTVDHGRAIATDAAGNVYTTGFFYRTVDFDPGVGVFNLTALGGTNDDFFISKLDSNGDFVWAVQTGGSNRDRGNAIRIDPSGNIYVGGFYSGSPAVDFDFGPCVLNLPGTDSFVEKITLGIVIPPPVITSFTPTVGPIGTSVTISGTGFSATPGDNGVKFFNDRTATVTASTPTSITAVVPASTTTGVISVTTNCLTATSAANFTISTPQNFITQWNLATAGSGATQLSFGTATSGSVNYTWQEISPGSASGSGSWSGATLTITGLPTGATIRLQIAPTNFQRIIINTGTDRNRLTRVEQWGTTSWTSMQNAFSGCANLQVTATDVPDLSGVTIMSGMFRFCTTLNSPTNIGSWNTSVVTDMSALFSQASAFNQNISSWNTGAVTNMSNLFADAAAFNQDIGVWNTASVTNMAGMFAGALIFNRNIGAWNTAAVNNMSSMFFSAYAFNQDISGWTTSAVTNMSSMFGYAYNFNQNIGSWNTSAVTTMSRMFEDAFDFNQNIGVWNTSAVTNMRGMFIDAYAFNQNIGAWNTSAVTDMSRMFDFATAFNQNIAAWNTTAVTNMSGMFADASDFNQNIGTWDLNPGVNLAGMLNNCNMDCNNYSATLIGWSTNPSTPNGKTLGATGRQYGTNAVAARTNLTATKGWTITGDTPSGAVCTAAVPTITSFTPTSGPVGTTVIITGTNFDTTPANNTVAFNGTTAVVTASTATSNTTTVPTGATTGKITVTVAGNTATSTLDFTVSSTANQPPVIEPATTAVPIEGIITLDLETLISDPDDNLDPTSLYLVNSVSEQGASASLDNAFILTLNYGSVQFFGTDRITIGICDLLAECAEQELTIEVGGDVVIYNAVSADGNGLNETFFLQYIDILPNTASNRVTIFNRWGDLVFEISDYNNDDRVFSGRNKNGNDLPSGTYFYKIEFNSGRQLKTGYLSLKR